jgi:hypothetical protein
VLIQQLPSPSHTTGAATMLLDLLDLGHDLHSIAKENRELKLPVRNPNQCERGHIW